MTKKILAVDVGFSSNKCKSIDKEWKFPSHIAPARTCTVDLGDKVPGYFWRNEHYIVGEPGNTATEAEKYSREISFLIDYCPLYIAHALSEQNDIPNILAVGLPLEQFRSHRDKLRESLSEFEVDGKHYKFDLRIFAQSVGALAEYVSAHRPPIDENGFVIDVGFNTALVLRYQGLEAKSAGSNQYSQFGISRALETLGTTLKSCYGESLTPLELNEVCKCGYLRLFGGKVDVKDKIISATSSHIDTLLKKIEDDYGRQFARADRLVLAGGGTYFLESHLPDKYHKLTTILKDPEFSNVRGYWHLAGAGQ